MKAHDSSGSSLVDPSNLAPPGKRPVSSLVDKRLLLSPPLATVKAKPKNPLAYLQEEFALLNMDGKLFLVDLASIDRRGNDGIAAKICLSNMRDGDLLIRRKLRAAYPNADANSLIRQFLIDPKTRCCNGVEFNPLGNSKNYLNLWVGPTIVPKHGSWTLISAFLLEIICAGDRACYEYLVGFITHALQRPWEKPGVLIALIGGQGIGKGTFGRILRRIWSATYLQINNIDSVTGNFNASLERAFIVFMDEALFSGDRRASDALKSLVTESVIQINEKYQAARQISSYHRFIAATNAEHFKNTERDDRRDFVLRLSEHRKGDHAYWQALHHEIDNGGVEAMVDDMLSADLSGFNIRNKPDTKELMEQKLQSLDSIQRWWYDCLYRGKIEGDEEATNSYPGQNAAVSNKDWPEFISTISAIDGILRVAGNKVYKKPSAVDVNRALKQLCPSAEQCQYTHKRSMRSRGFRLPLLEHARSEFETFIGGKPIWPEYSE